MTNEHVQPAVLGISAVTGFEVARRWIPNDTFLGKYADVAFGVTVMAAGYWLGVKALFAFGVGATVEGALIAFGL